MHLANGHSRNTRCDRSFLFSLRKDPQPNIHRPKIDRIAKEIVEGQIGVDSRRIGASATGLLT